MNNYFITGASGHIGNIIVKKLIKNNGHVRCLFLPSDDTSEFEKLGCEVIKGNILDKALIKNCIKENDVVIHLAGIISISKKNRDLIMKVNYEGTKYIADACLKNHARLVFVSTVDILNLVKDKKITEEVGLKDTYRSPYEESKSLATRYVFDLFGKGLNGVVIYPSAVIGPDDYFLGEVSNALIMLYNKKMPAYIKGGYSFVDARDVADGIIAAADNHSLTNKGYILSNEYISIKDLMKTVYTHYGYKHMPGYCPLFLVYLGLPFIALYAEITRKKPIFTRIMLKTVLADIDFDNSLARKDLNFKTRGLDESIIDSIEWIKTNFPQRIKHKK